MTRIWILLMVLSFFLSVRCEAFTLWQLPEQTPSQMMSYVIQTQGGKIIVIDGGKAGDASYLRGFLAALGNKVDIWFVTHPHSDHIEALSHLLLSPDRPDIGRIYASLPTKQWAEKYAEQGSRDSTTALQEAAGKAGMKITDLKLGKEFKVDELRIEVLGVKNPEITANAVNNSSVVLRFSDSRKAVLFLADLGVEGGDKLLAKYRERLKSDYVQMAHHGQAGVGKDVYKAIDAHTCLWPTPRWLWDNDRGGGPDTGPWKTLEVRAWMDDLGITRHHVSADGLHRID